MAVSGALAQSNFINLPDAKDSEAPSYQRVARPLDQRVEETLDAQLAVLMAGGLDSPYRIDHVTRLGPLGTQVVLQLGLAQTAPPLPGPERLAVSVEADSDTADLWRLRCGLPLAALDDRAAWEARIALWQWGAPAQWHAERDAWRQAQTAGVSLADHAAMHAELEQLRGAKRKWDAFMDDMQLAAARFESDAAASGAAEKRPRRIPRDVSSDDDESASSAT